MKPLITLATSLLVGFLACTDAQAIDCAKATSRVEAAICADPALLAADDAMSKAYGEVRSLSTKVEREMLRLAQRAWIAERDQACGAPPADVASCVGTRTARRLDEFLGKSDGGPGNGSRVIPTYVVREGAPGLYKLDVSLMRFAAPKSGGERRFNRWIGDIAADLPVMKQDGDGESPYLEALVDVSITYLSPELLSAYALTEFYGAGAHPSHSGISVNIDMRSGKELAVEDVFSEPAAAGLVNRCYDQIVAEKKERLDDPNYDPASDSSLDRNVVAEHVATLSQWSFGEREAVLHFNEYTVGPYVEGSYGCTFPAAELKALALPGAPLP